MLNQVQYHQAFVEKKEIGEESGGFQGEKQTGGFSGGYNYRYKPAAQV